MNAHIPMHKQPLQPWPKRELRRYNCGKAGVLTAREAAKQANVALSTIYRRVGEGITGDALVRPYVPKPPRGIPPVDLNFTTTASRTFHQGVWMHRVYGDKPPTARQLMNDMGYTRATAFRRVRSYKDALGLP